MAKGKKSGAKQAKAAAAVKQQAAVAAAAAVVATSTNGEKQGQRDEAGVTGGHGVDADVNAGARQAQVEVNGDRIVRSLDEQDRTTTTHVQGKPRPRPTLTPAQLARQRGEGPLTTMEPIAGTLDTDVDHLQYTHSHDYTQHHQQQQQQQQLHANQARPTDRGHESTQPLSGINSYPNYPYPPTSVTSLHQPGFLAPPTAPASSAHGLGLGPTLVVLDDPSNKYLQAQQSFYATHPPSHTSVTSSIPDVPPPLPVSLPRLPCIPPLVVHQEQLYFDDGLGAPGRCPHERKWGEIGKEHKEHRGLGLSDVEMDDFMVDLGDLVSKEYDAWIERCW